MDEHRAAETRRAIKAIALGLALGALLARLARKTRPATAQSPA